MGQRTGELHMTLASETQDPAFAPEDFGRLYQRARYQSMRGLTVRVLQQLQEKSPALTDRWRESADHLLKNRNRLIDRFQEFTRTRIGGTRIRCHGDYHLGQVLFTGRDFVIIDFEGEPARSLTERRVKRSPLTDVAGMLRSFSYAARFRLFSPDFPESSNEGEIRRLEPWARLWEKWISSVFLGSYFKVTWEGGLIPAEKRERIMLLDTFLLEKAVYELGYELNNRPRWVHIPLSDIWQILES